MVAWSRCRIRWALLSALIALSVRSGRRTPSWSGQQVPNYRAIFSIVRNGMIAARNSRQRVGWPPPREITGQEAYQRPNATLEGWLKDAKRSGVAAVTTFAAGLQ